MALSLTRSIHHQRVRAFLRRQQLLIGYMAAKDTMYSVASAPQHPLHGLTSTALVPLTPPAHAPDPDALHRPGVRKFRFQRGPSGRAKCRHCSAKIAKKTVRVQMKTAINDLRFTDEYLFHVACLPAVAHVGRFTPPAFDSMRDTNASATQMQQK